MAEVSLLSKDYLLTIESMRSEVESLRSKLTLIGSSPKNNCEDSNFEDIQTDFDNCTQQIEDLNAEITDKTSQLRELRTDQDWLIKEYPQ